MRQEQQQNSERSDLVIGRGPVAELLASGRQVECLFVQKSLSGLGRLAGMARERGVPVKESTAARLDTMCAHANHQGVIAQVSGARYSELEDVFARAADEPVLLVVADGIEDPHNLGAIIRTAEAAGAHGIIIPKRRSAGLSFTVSKTSAGAAEHLPVVRVSNLAATVDLLKKRGVWCYAADMGGTPWCEVDYAGPAALIVGSEGRGVSRLLREKCDVLVSLPMRGAMSSLNASVAAGVVLYEIARGRLGLGRRG